MTTYIHTCSRRGERATSTRISSIHGIVKDRNREKERRHSRRFFPAARQGAVRYNPQLIRLNGAQRARPRGCGGFGRNQQSSVVNNGNHYRRNRDASTVSPDERGSNSSCRKITLSRCRETERKRERGRTEGGGGGEEKGMATERTGTKKVGRGENSRGFFIFSGELRRTYVKYRGSTVFHEMPSR